MYQILTILCIKYSNLYTICGYATLSYPIFRIMFHNLSNCILVSLCTSSHQCLVGARFLYHTPSIRPINSRPRLKQFFFRMTGTFCRCPELHAVFFQADKFYRCVLFIKAHLFCCHAKGRLEPVLGVLYSNFSPAVFFCVYLKCCYQGYM